MNFSNTHLLVKYHDYLFDNLKKYTKSEDIKPNEVDLNNFVKVSEIEVGVDMYLIDDNGLLFKRHDYSIAGFKQNNEIVWINL